MTAVTWALAVLALVLGVALMLAGWSFTIDARRGEDRWEREVEQLHLCAEASDNGDQWRRCAGLAVER